MVAGRTISTSATVLSCELSVDRSHLSGSHPRLLCRCSVPAVYRFVAFLHVDASNHHHLAAESHGPCAARTRAAWLLPKWRGAHGTRYRRPFRCRRLESRVVNSRKRSLGAFLRVYSEPLQRTYMPASRMSWRARFSHQLSRPSFLPFSRRRDQSSLVCWRHPSHHFSSRFSLELSI